MTQGTEEKIRATMIRIGLRDPFIQGIAGIVAIATAVSIAISTFGDGKKTIIAVALALIFGVVLIVFRVLILNVNNTLVKWVCIFASTTITGVFLIFVILTIPAVTFCWPPPYAHFLGVATCVTEGTSFADLLDQRDEPVGIYPVNYFKYQEKVGDKMIYRRDKNDRRTLLTVESFADDPTKQYLRAEFDVLRKIKAKRHTFCVLRERMFGISYYEYDNSIKYILGRNRRGMISIVRLTYPHELKHEFDPILTDLAHHFIADSNRTKVLQETCDDV